MELVGRRRERQILEQAIASSEAELVCLYGRRRVGKTFLVREVLGERIAFELVGTHGASLREQLASFTRALVSVGGSHESATGWPDAFARLADTLGPTRAKKRVIFLDELPWLATPRSGFMSAFEHFWNSWAVKRRDLVVVVCGSAAAWMVRALLHARGGLHNRVTRQIRLEPFTVGEVEEYFRARKIDLGRYQTLELYAALGGIPHYLRQVERGNSASLAIDRLCFAHDGPLRDEFEKLYTSLFEHPGRHIEIVRALGTASRSLTRSELLKTTRATSGGRTSATLAELEESGFVMRTPEHGLRSREATYRLTDEYSLFFLRWIERHHGRADGIWTTKRGTPAWRSWSGYAFEGICLKHVAKLKRALGIEAVETEESAWQHRPETRSDRGAQVDLVIDRRDACINLCEMKFSEGEFVIDKAYADELRNKRDTFRRVTGTRKALLLTMVTTHGVRDNAYARELVDKQLTADALFG
jgi:uncharacterized protein